MEQEKQQPVVFGEAKNNFMINTPHFNTILESVLQDLNEGKKSYSSKQAKKGKDIGKPGKQFAKIAKTAGKKYGSKEAGKKVAGAVLKKLRKK